MPDSSGTDELARARLAYISAGQPALSAPRRALAAASQAVTSSAGSVVEEPQPPATAPGRLAEPEPRASALPWIPDGTLRRRYVVAILLLLLAGLGITMAVLGRSSASQIALEPTPVVQTVVPTAPSPSVSSPVQLRIHVLGAVAEPGVVTVPDGSIVADALDAAGGLLPDADPAELNLAARLADGQQVIVGTTSEPMGDVRDQPGTSGPTGAAGTPGSEGALVNLNTASQGQLEELPGVGPVLAGEIIAWREGNGGFASVADLEEVSGVGPKTFAALEPLVTV